MTLTKIGGDIADRYTMSNKTEERTLRKGRERWGGIKEREIKRKIGASYEAEIHPDRYNARDREREKREENVLVVSRWKTNKNTLTHSGYLSMRARERDGERSKLHRTNGRTDGGEKNNKKKKEKKKEKEKGDSVFSLFLSEPRRVVHARLYFIVSRLYIQP